MAVCAVLKPRRVVITGLGVLSCLGVGVKVNWEHILRGESGIKVMDGPEWQNAPCRLAGLIPRGSGAGELCLEECFSASDRRTLPLATMYALLAAKEALLDSGWMPETEHDQERSGVAVGMGMISLDDVVAAGKQLETGYKKISPYFIPRILTNMAAGHVSIRHKLKGPNHAVSTACATGLHAVGDAFRFIQRGDANVMVCGGTEAAVTPLAVAGFSRLGALCTDYEEPSRASRPFDVRRSGFVLSEGAGMLVLEEHEHAVRRGARAYAEVLGYGLSADAHHPTAPHPDGYGAVRSMRAAMRDAGVAVNDNNSGVALANYHCRRVTYINAHATSTPMGDDIEAAAIEKVFGSEDRAQDGVSVSSCKGSLGHLLGAAGSVEALVTALACHHAVLPPTANLDQPSTPNMSFTHVAKSATVWQPRHLPNCRIALTNSFGFGGTNASVCIGNMNNDS